MLLTFLILTMGELARAWTQVHGTTRPTVRCTMNDEIWVTALAWRQFSAVTARSERLGLSSSDLASSWYLQLQASLARDLSRQSRVTADPVRLFICHDCEGSIPCLYGP
ncbi:hypothetical protein F4821DRAFT_237553 [Hypoxylon rubiginosum]|uniref:Uncharacterized protein n=1 Tax=Hypoxylon rubiginosum TaxID=110542 RepID=A0ACC0D2A4_9PEZI|nr:hypothetical protein F4821DRAFT_237553 [Hypoxylon rubiginosum]